MQKQCTYCCINPSIPFVADLICTVLQLLWYQCYAALNLKLPQGICWHRKSSNSLFINRHELAPAQHYLYYKKEALNPQRHIQIYVKNFLAQKPISELGEMIYTWNLSTRDAVMRVEGQLGYLGNQSTSEGIVRKDIFKMKIRIHII